MFTPRQAKSLSYTSSFSDSSVVAVKGSLAVVSLLVGKYLFSALSVYFLKRGLNDLIIARDFILSFVIYCMLFVKGDSA